MKIKISLLLLSIAVFFYSCKDDSELTPVVSIGFEDVVLPANLGYYNGSDGKGSFKSGMATLFNSYNPTYSSWSGWAASSKTDTANRGDDNFTNQYSVYALSGAGGSKQFAVAYVLDSSVIALDRPMKAVSCQISNSTYAYHDMKNGSRFSKKMGGPKGEDHDFFFVSIIGYNAEGKKTGEVRHYLADFRHEPGITREIKVGWKLVNLAPLGTVSKLVFKLTSSDVGQYGMNTPAYFCLDDLRLQ